MNTEFGEATTTSDIRFSASLNKKKEIRLWWVADYIMVCYVAMTNFQIPLAHTTEHQLKESPIIQILD